ncbi:MAG: sigma-70 family RNA polymerase sigma factor [Pseudonocardia sp.]|nr:sigma-70 family RNA polymerase sigma factor [Pseudonocardia sp.]
MRHAAEIGAVVRELAPQVLAALVRHYGRFDACEDAVQEALVDATVAWSERGVPENPRGWLIRVAARRLADRWRSDSARRRREIGTAAVDATSFAQPADADQQGDDSLTLLFLCCHPALSPPSQVALTLRAVGGLSTAEIARAFLVPEATMAQRISRAKQQITAAGARFEMPAKERAQRLAAVLHVLYLVFNEGYVASAGPAAHRVELTDEAIRLARQVHERLPEDGEVAGLLALMLLTDARRPARTTADGDLVPLDEQDRGRWDRDRIAEGSALVTRALTRSRIGPFQLQAAIAAVHAETTTAAETDWPQILALYDLLARFPANPVVLLNRAVAVAMVHGPRAGLDALAEVADDRRLAGHHRWHAVRAHLLDRAGDRAAAVSAYAEAARRATSLPEQRYLTAQATRLRAR